MRPQKIKTRCTKKSSKKCEQIVRAYDKVQLALLDVLEADEEIASFKCNVPLKGDSAEGFSTDFVCEKTNGELAVYECTYKSKLMLPRTMKLLDISRTYWLRRGITDWTIVVDKEGC